MKMAARLVASILVLRQFTGVAASLGGGGAFSGAAEEQATAAECYGAGGFTAEVWPHCQRINQDMLVYHKMTSDSAYLMLGLHVTGYTGWSALALGGNGGMKGASHIVVRKVDGEFVAEDRFSLDYTFPQLDAEQNVRLMFASEENGGTSWGVLLPMKSCDEDDYPVEDVSRWMLWAKGTAAGSHDISYHGSSERGQFHINLVSGPTTPPDFSGLHTVDMTMSNVEVVHAGDPSQQNVYKCEIFDLEQIIGDGRNVTDKHHVAKMAAKLDADSAPYVHHMILYECEESEGFEHTQHGYVIQDCENMPPGCNGMKYAWALGGNDVIMPDNAGFPFGEGKRWLAIQMHYYNPQRHDNIFDSSGLTLTFVPENRVEDAGMMRLNAGTSPQQREPIPAGQADYRISPLIVPPQCTSGLSRDLTVLATVHHQHLTGTFMNIDVSRDGVSLGPMRRERRFDFNHQSIEPSAFTTLKAGDQLSVTCGYDTTLRPDPTPFGDYSSHEMCIAFFMYWPKVDDEQALFLPVPEGAAFTRTRCAGQLQQFIATAPTMPECAVSGLIDSPEADAHIKEAGYGPAPEPEPEPEGMGHLLLLLGGGCALVAAIAGFYTYWTRAGSGFQEQKDEDEVEVGTAS